MDTSQHPVADKRAKVFRLTVLGCGVLLALNPWPGLTEAALLTFPLMCLVLPVVLAWGPLVLVLAVVDLVRKSPEIAPPRPWGLAAAGVLLVTVGLLWAEVPLRLAFAVCHGPLVPLAESPPVVKGPTPLRRFVGIYYVDEYAADPRGGVFFRTSDSAEGTGPDRMSYGFAYQPNRQGTPFGNARATYTHLFGPWYTFAVSNDY